MHLKQSRPGTDETGTIMFRSAPDCTEPYRGPFKRMTAFVVGYDTDDEKLFMKSDRSEAIRYAKDNKLTFDQVLASQLCDEIAEDLFA